MAYQKTVPTPTDASIILTYRCPMKCKMCNIWFNPTNKSEEIKASDLRTLPKLKFINLTGGEPFVREDLAEIVEECYRHTDRIVISTSGWFEDRVVALAKNEASYQLSLFDSLLPSQVLSHYPLQGITADMVYAAAMAQPFQGRLLSEWAENLESDRLARIVNLLRHLRVSVFQLTGDKFFLDHRFPPDATHCMSLKSNCQCIAVFRFP